MKAIECEDQREDMIVYSGKCIYCRFYWVDLLFNCLFFTNYTHCILIASFELIFFNLKVKIIGLRK